MLSNKEIQKWLRDEGLYTTSAPDGILGLVSWQGIQKALVRALGKGPLLWTEERQLVAVQQLILGVEPDGYVGPDTRYALERWQDAQRVDSDAPALQYGKWPTQKEWRATVVPGEHLRDFTSPYPLRLAWAPQQRRQHLRLHSTVGDSAVRVLASVLQHYGYERLQQLGLDLFAGDYANRPVRGGTLPSMHAYGCAIDWHSEANQLRWGADQALFAKPEYETWWKCWEGEGWVSLGREKNFDWMHVQAARL